MSYIHVVIFVITHLFVSFICLEVFLRLQNTVESIKWLWSVRRLLVLSVYAFLAASIFFGMSWVFPHYSDDIKTNGFLVWIYIVLVHMFKFFLPRQKYLNKKQD